MKRIEIRAGFWLIAGLWLLLLPLRLCVGVVLAAAVHEAGHLLAIRLTCGKVHRVELSASGCRIVTGPMTPARELLCALAGPAAGASVILLWRWFPEAAAAAAVQTAFNLFPIYPLDGGRALHALGQILLFFTGSCKNHRNGIQ